MTVSPSRLLLPQALSIFEEEVQGIKSVDGLVPNLVSYALSRNAIAAMKQRGGNALGIEGDEPLISKQNHPTHTRSANSCLVILISTAWSDAAGDAAVNSMTDNTISRIRETAESLGVANRYLYINYASAQQAHEVFAGYGEENLQRLREIQRKVDPHSVYTSQGLWRGYVKLV